ncbi:MAG: DUF6470 family protein [Christensenellaceae bacterium]|jgi:hypothetical protein
MKTLSIQTTRPTLDITSTRAQLNITNKIRRFTSKRTPPQMTVQRQAPSFKVDWSTVWAQSGRRSPEKLQQHMRQVSRQKVDQAIQRTVKNGDYLGKLNSYIDSKRDPIGELAFDNMLSDMPELNVASMPESMPDIVWDPGGIKIEWTTGEITIDWDDDYMPDVTVSPHSVEIKLSGRSEVKITVNPDRVEQTRNDGRKINEKI